MVGVFLPVNTPPPSSVSCFTLRLCTSTSRLDCSPSGTQAVSKTSLPQHPIHPSWREMGAGQLLTICLTLSVTIAGTGAPPTTVNGTRGHSVSLPTGIPVRPDDAEVVWSRVSPRVMIVKYLKGNITYFGPEEYKRRITFQRGDFSLEIRDLRREDSGDYEVTVAAAGSGAESKTTMRLEVHAPDTTAAKPPTTTTTKTTATGSGLQKIALTIGLLVLGVILISPLVVILIVKCRRRAAGREGSSNTEDPEGSETIYANVVRREDRQFDRRHDQENNRVMAETVPQGSGTVVRKDLQ
ncbi:uncharacterized protein LOC134355847 [Mobula hypostoma]|uniref:uncharacterized protein LOC134355847 n=1 Tax=Mobula hypostoma TaxID=723540 RepID=UPI002FC2EE1E